MNGACNGTFFLAPPPGALGRGQKVKYHQISLKLNYKVNLKDFLTKFCVSSHTWKILNISDGIFIWRPGSCPRGRTWGYRGGLGGSKIFFSEIHPDMVCEFLTWKAYAPAPFLGSPPPGALGRGQKVKYHWIWIKRSISKIFKPNFVYLLTNERYKTYQLGFSFSCLGHGPEVGLRGTVGGGGLLTWMAHAPAQFFGSLPPGALGRGQKFNFLNMVMWHIKLTGMSSRPGYTEKFNLRSNWWPWDGVKVSITIRFLWERGDLRWRAIECVLVFTLVLQSFWWESHQKCKIEMTNV